jgi:hypothetical protein
MPLDTQRSEQLRTCIAG